jgi:Kef-type K+ transport system membrane component KefB
MTTTLFVFLSGFDYSLPLTNPVLKFLLILIIILLTPILFNKIKIPQLLGLIIAGAIIGPNGFNLMERDSSIILSGTAGLLYIMFLAGLEIDMGEFKKNSGRSLYFGLLTFIIPMGLGTAAGYYLLDFPLPTSILLASMFASHTLISYPIVSKFGVAKDKAVNITVGGTMITDTLALLVLAVIVGMTVGEVNQEFWTRLSISISIFALIVMLVFPLIGRWFFKQYEDNVSQYIFVLVMVFFGAVLAEMAGVEAIIGAFLAGLALNRLIPHTSPLMNRVEFVGNAIFIPFFLIGVGMLIDYRAFFTGWETITVAAVMTIIALSSKYVAAWLTQKSFKFSDDQRRLIFGLSAAQAAATLAAVLVGYNVFTKEFDTIDSVSSSMVSMNENYLITKDNTKLRFNEMAENLPAVGDSAMISNRPIDDVISVANGLDLVFEQGELIEIRRYKRLLNEAILNGSILMILFTCTVASFQAQKGAKNIAVREMSEADVSEDDSKERILVAIDRIESVEEMVNFMVTIKSKKNTKNLYGLTIVDDKENPTVSEKAAKKILDLAEVTASSTDNSLEPLLRYDINIVNGISNVIKEQKITDLIMAIKEDKGFSDTFLNKLNMGILTKNGVTTILYKPTQPLATIKRNLIFIPKNAELEMGFGYWLIKMWNLAKSTGAKMVFYGSETTLAYIEKVKDKHPIEADFVEFTDWDDFLILARDVKKEDSLIIVGSRKNHPSYHPIMTKIPNYLNKYFKQNNFILIYPAQGESLSDLTKGDLKNPSLVQPLEKLDEIGKTIVKLFKKP